MKKIDLHIHTIPTISDAKFVFSISKLKEYILKLQIDAIAITNHNIFNKDQFYQIKNELKELCVVLPGIEINIGNKGFGHIICICDEIDIDEFEYSCELIKEKIKKSDDKISYEELKSIFGDFNKYLWIPHYDKKPAVEDYIIDKMKGAIQCGEVGSVKKFLYCQKDDKALIPVYFSDMRPSDDLTVFPSRQTYLDVGDISVDSIKKTLIDRTHVSLTEIEGNGLFYVLPDLPISTRLNIIIGERSSGKTFTLDQIAIQNENIKYIKQFELIEPEPEKAAKKFVDSIAEKRSSFAEEYFEQFKDSIDVVKSISLDENDKSIDQYISSLIRYAKEADRADMFAKCTLYGESLYPKRSIDNICELIDAVEIILDSREYRDIIDESIDRFLLIKLHSKLIKKYNEEKCKSLKEEWVNKTVKKIKEKLKYKTAAVDIPDVDLYKYQMDKIKVKKFNRLVEILKEESVINSQSIEGFSVQTKKRSFNGAGELKNISGKRNISFSEIMDIYSANPYMFLQKLKDLEGIPETEYYKYFVYVEYQIINQFGFPVSGGERAEFKLLQEINDAKRYDMLLIDEPESSFDNIFLRDKVNHIIKEISRIMPVVLVTHNNTVGASIKPDYVIYTKRSVDGGVVYNRFYGLPSDKMLVSSNGESIKNICAIMDCLEAGEETYNERKREYEILQD